MIYRCEPVTFDSAGDRIAGLLFEPAAPSTSGPVRTFVLLGPVSFVKEQSPLQYATRLARAGHRALIFDPRGFGQSEGEPRLFDNPRRKVDDVVAAVDHLLARPEVDPEGITGLGICMGCNWMAQAVADDPRLRRVVLLVGAYSIRSRRIEQAGGVEAFERQLAGYRDELDRFAATGVPAHHTLVAADMADSYFSWAVPYHWYRMWIDPGPLRYKGAWENRLARISDHDHYAFDVAEPLSRVTVPTLVINSTDSATPLDAVRPLFDLIPATEKELVVTGDQIQVQFYDDPLTIDTAVDAILSRLGDGT